jgi:hypothetical protein
MVSRPSRQLLIILFISLLTAFTILILWPTHIAPNANLTIYSQNVYSLIFYVPPVLWIGIVGLGVLFVLLGLGKMKGLSPEFEFRCGLAILLVIFIVFYGLPNAIEPNPRFTDSWVHGTTAKAILTSGKLQLGDFSYQAYPSSFIFLSTLSLVTGAQLTLLLRFLPLMFIVLFFTLLVVFAKRLLNDPMLALVFAFIYGLSTFNLTFHFSPEIFGWLMLFIVLIFLATVAHENTSNGITRENFVVLALVVVSIAITHPVTQFLLLIIFLFFSVLLVARRTFWKTKSVVVSLSVLMVISFSAWATSFGWPDVVNILDAFKSAFKTIFSNPNSSIAARPFQESYPYVVSLLLEYRQVLYVSVLLAAIAGGYLFWKHERSRLDVLLSLLVAAGIAAPVTFLGVLPLERTIILAFIPLCVFAAYVVTRKKRVGGILLIILVFTIPVNFASLYYSEASKMTHDWEVSSAIFAGSNFHGTILSEYRETGVLEYYGNFSKIYNDYYLVGQRPDVFNFIFIENHGIQLVYLTQLTIESFSSTGKILNETSFLESPSFNCIYSNGYSQFLLRSSAGK